MYKSRGPRQLVLRTSCSNPSLVCGDDSRVEYLLDHTPVQPSCGPNSPVQPVPPNVDLLLFNLCTLFILLNMELNLPFAYLFLSGYEPSDQARTVGETRFVTLLVEAGH